MISGFYAADLSFDLIGHTSNTLYTPDYVCERMVSTRKLKNFEIREDCIYCECGTSVKQLSLTAVEAGVKGFEGTVDLPGTVASAIYGHATCFGSDISNLLLEATILTSDGNVVKVGPKWFEFSRRSSALKRGEKKVVILTVLLQRNNGDAEELKREADYNHATRKSSQPDAKNSLGSIFVRSNKRTFLNYCLTAVIKLYSITLRIIGYNSKNISKKRKHLLFTMLKATDVEPYVYNWNWYRWTDEKSHDLFWKFVQVRKRMFTHCDFEIEIKHKKGFKIP